ncbi:MAG: transcription termination factor Rho [Calditrichaeota bacterium]|nr:transcription termination factor Rho [Calditrichota bacterium]
MNSNVSETASGVLQRLKQGGGFLRDPARSFQPGREDVWLSSQLMRKYGLVDGAVVSGAASRGKKGWQLETVESVCGLKPEQFQARIRFDRLLAIDPTDRFRVGDGGNVTMRTIELIAPIGKGTRGLIVAPPKTGKTRILEELANAIHASDPDTRIVVLLIDERPEEVTHFRRNVQAEVLASSNDQSLESHINLAELTLAHVRCELECGRDIVVLVDSITRMGRAFNRHGTGSRRTMSGGLDAGALEIPRRFFGLARNVEHGGSVTVIATALIETGSRMDDLIFEEFKGTGNCEIVLDRSLADARIFPAINLLASGTRKEELLYTADEMQWLTALRRRLADAEPKAAMHALLKLLETEPGNDDLLQGRKPGR